MLVKDFKNVGIENILAGIEESENWNGENESYNIKFISYDIVPSELDNIDI